MFASLARLSKLSRCYFKELEKTAAKMRDTHKTGGNCHFGNGLVSLLKELARTR